MINRIFKKYLSDIGEKISNGKLTIILPNNESLEFFGKGDLKSNLKLNSYMPILRTITSGHVGFAESYLKGEWTSSDLESLLEIMVTNLPEAFSAKARFILHIIELFIFLEKIQNLGLKRIFNIIMTLVMISISFG